MALRLFGLKIPRLETLVGRSSGKANGSRRGMIGQADEAFRSVVRKWTRGPGGEGNCVEALSSPYSLHSLFCPFPQCSL